MRLIHYYRDELDWDRLIRLVYDSGAWEMFSFSLLLLQHESGLELPGRVLRKVSEGLSRPTGTERRLLELCRSGTPWREAVRLMLERTGNQRYRRLMEKLGDRSIADWWVQIELPRNATALDVGAGMGTLTEAIAPHCSHVVALEPVRERIEFCRHRFREAGLGGVSCVRADALELPFGEGTF